MLRLVTNISSSVLCGSTYSTYKVFQLPKFDLLVWSNTISKRNFRKNVQKKCESKVFSKLQTEYENKFLDILNIMENVDVLQCFTDGSIFRKDTSYYVLIVVNRLESGVTSV